MKRQRKRWQSLSARQQRWIVIQATAQTLLLLIAGIDLARRPADKARGAKPWWAVALLIQPVGPVAYLLRGRRPSGV